MMALIILIYLFLVLTLCMLYDHDKKHKILQTLRWLLHPKLDQRRDINSIPGPQALPFFGTKWIFFWKYKMSKMHEMFRDLHRSYGPIVLEKAGSFPIVNLFDRKDIETVLRYSSKYPYRPPTEILVHYRKSRPDRYASVGFSNAQGAEWHFLRTSLMSNIMSRQELNKFIPALNKICDDFIDLLKVECRRGTIHNFENLINLMVLEAVCCLILGRRMGYLSNNSDSGRFAELVTAVKNIFVIERDSYYGVQLWKYIPTKLYRDFSKNEEIIYNIISDIVDNSLKDGLDGDQNDDDDMKNIFLTILQNDQLDIRDKKSGIIDTLTAGIQTLSNTLCFLIYHLTQHKQSQQKILRDFENCDRHFTADDIYNATYTKACLQESYRMTPVAFCIARILEQDYTLSGYNVKAGTFVLCQTMIACQNEANFKNAQLYRPERWLNEDETKLETNNSNSEPGASLVLPFGIGKRSCPGKKFIEIWQTLLMGRLIREFEIEFIGDLDIQFEFILSPKTPVKVVLRERGTE